jgi:two-component system, chemotaxis family, CheB/CheR fusion protein
MNNQAEKETFLELLEYLKQKRGFDFTGYKPTSLTRRIKRRMQMVNIVDFTDYIDYLEVQPDEFSLLFNTILINVTGFFRDQDAWDVIRDRVIPEIMKNKRPNDLVRVWSTGCASGEEAYTAAILLAEALSEDQFRDRVKIYGTDVDEDALAKARQGAYTAKELEGAPEYLREKYFTEVGGLYSFNKELRRNLIFGRNDIIQDAPISRIDLLICRNTLMYFNIETQLKILARFHFALNDQGYLFLGKAESLLSHTVAFSPVDIKKRIFKKAQHHNPRERVTLGNEVAGEEAQPPLFSLLQLRDAALDTFPVPVLVLNTENHLEVANDQARRLLGLSPRDLGRPFQDLEISYRPVELRSQIQRTCLELTPVLISDVPFPSQSGVGNAYYTIRIQPLLDPANSLLGVSITFVDVTHHKRLQNELEKANSELETTNEELQSTNEELETMNEELQSTNEELETTNEELQSTNEELETMNEELQSTNEELNTMNEEMQLRSEDLHHLNTFLDSILTSLQMGVIVVDKQMRVQAWNARATDLWGVRGEEVEGQNLLSLDIGLPVEILKKAILLSQDSDSEPQIEIFPATNRRGKQIQIRVSCSPFVGKDRQSRGAIILVEELNNHP